MWNVSLSCPAAERGSALILAVLVAGIVAGLGVGLAQDFMLDAARTENRLDDGQARLYLLAAEEIAVLALRGDRLQGEADHQLEAWARPLPPLPTDRGSVELRLEDAQGRFNLNSLAERKPGLSDLGLPIEQRFTLAQRVFMQLVQGFAEHPVTSDQALALTEALIDWMDADDEVLGFGGAESLYYISDAEPRAPANALLQSVNELKAVRHMDAGLYQQLRPLVVALPQSTALNLNTASEPLLRALAAALEVEPGQLEELRLRQQTRPLESIAELADFPWLEGSNEASNSLGVASDYFLLTARVVEGGAERSVQSLLWRGEDSTRVLTRHFGSPLETWQTWQ